MNALIRVCTGFLIMGLISCAGHYSQLNRHGAVNQCKQLCVQKLQSCRSTCVNNCPNCCGVARVNSATNYAKYVHEQRIKGVFIARELNSYRDPLQCRKITCNCSADFSTCTQNCTGVIQKRLQAVPYCG